MAGLQVDVTQNIAPTEIQQPVDSFSKSSFTDAVNFVSDKLSKDRVKQNKEDAYKLLDKAAQVYEDTYRDKQSSVEAERMATRVIAGARNADIRELASGLYVNWKNTGLGGEILDEAKTEELRSKNEIANNRNFVLNAMSTYGSEFLSELTGIVGEDKLKAMSDDTLDEKQAEDLTFEARKLEAKYVQANMAARRLAKSNGDNPTQDEVDMTLVLSTEMRKAASEFTLVRDSLLDPDTRPTVEMMDEVRKLAGTKVVELKELARKQRDIAVKANPARLEKINKNYESTIQEIDALESTLDFPEETMKRWADAAKAYENKGKVDMFKYAGAHQRLLQVFDKGVLTDFAISEGNLNDKLSDMLKSIAPASMQYIENGNVDVTKLEKNLKSIYVDGVDINEIPLEERQAVVDTLYSGYNQNIGSWKDMDISNKRNVVTSFVSLAGMATNGSTDEKARITEEILNTQKHKDFIKELKDSSDPQDQELVKALTYVTTQLNIDTIADVNGGLLSADNPMSAVAGRDSLRYDAEKGRFATKASGKEVEQKNERQAALKLVRARSDKKLADSINARIDSIIKEKEYHQFFKDKSDKEIADFIYRQAQANGVAPVVIGDKGNITDFTSKDVREYLVEAPVDPTTQKRQELEERLNRIEAGEQAFIMGLEGDVKAREDRIRRGEAEPEPELDAESLTKLRVKAFKKQFPKEAEFLSDEEIAAELSGN